MVFLGFGILLPRLSTPTLALAALTIASGVEFCRLFLNSMIRIQSSPSTHQATGRLERDSLAKPGPSSNRHAHGKNTPG